MGNKGKALVLCGPTATGKTALGIKLAKKYNGEILSADSRQVYKGMNIGTGKDLPLKAVFNKKLSLSSKTGSDPAKGLVIGFFDFNKIPVWLLDIVKPDYQFSVADYVKCANLVIEDIYKRGKLPIIIGGTGLYIKGLIDGIETMGVLPDWELRKKLAHCSIVELLNCLEKLDYKKWQSMNNSDRNNPRRLIRAIEIALSNSPNSPNSHDAFFIGLTAPYKTLYQRIDERVEKRIKMGMEDEIKSLQALGYNFENSAMGTTIGYSEWRRADGLWQMMDSDLRNEIIQKWKFAEHAYARRQMTWFKKDKRINWFEINEPDLDSKIEKVIDKWYNE